MKFNKNHIFLLLFFLLSINYSTKAQTQKSREIVAYWHGDTKNLTKYPIEKLNKIIYSFLGLRGNKLVLTSEDSVQLSKMKNVKSENQELKILVSLGGWGGCQTCSNVFSTSKGREEFSISVLKILQDYNIDGIDLDWEYPALPSLPGHGYSERDKQNFTLLIKELRNVLGQNFEISFAAGGFEKFLQNSVEWSLVMPLVDYVNLMTYDIVNGNSTETGHHTPLYGNKSQKESVDFVVTYLKNLNIPSEKIVIGAAFYGRIFENVSDTQHGMYQSGKFKTYINHKDISKQINTANGYKYYYDRKSKATWAYNKEKNLFATFDDKKSIKAKTKYMQNQQLGGIMFWDLNGDDYSDGLLDVIYDTLH